MLAPSYLHLPIYLHPLGRLGPVWTDLLGHGPLPSQFREYQRVYQKAQHSLTEQLANWNVPVELCLHPWCNRSLMSSRLTCAFAQQKPPAQLLSTNASLYRIHQNLISTCLGLSTVWIGCCYANAQRMVSARRMSGNYRQLRQEPLRFQLQRRGSPPGPHHMRALKPRLP